MDGFEHKTTIITGATQGPRKKTARLSVEKGLKKIVITGRNAARAKAVAKELETAGCDVLFIEADLDQQHWRILTWLM